MARTLLALVDVSARRGARCPRTQTARGGRLDEPDEADLRFGMLAMEKQLGQLKERLAEIEDLWRLVLLLDWDRYTMMPPAGAGAQVLEVARRDLPDLDGSIEAGDFGGLRSWLHEHIHRHGGKFTLAETLQRVVGGPIDPEPYLAYLDRKVADVYGERD